MQPTKLQQIADLHPSLESVSTVVKELEIKLKGISTRVHARIWLTSDPDDPYQIQFSHYVKTASQADPYQPSRPTAATEDDAVKKAVAVVCGFADDAVRKGEKPSRSWLVRNAKWTKSP